MNTLDLIYVVAALIAFLGIVLGFFAMANDSMQQQLSVYVGLVALVVFIFNLFWSNPAYRTVVDLIGLVGEMLAVREVILLNKERKRKFERNLRVPDPH